MGQAIRNSDVKNDKAINGKSLYWNLLATAYVDEGYSEDEKRLIKYIARLLDIDRTVTLEMESALKTLLAIEEEELKTYESIYMKQLGCKPINRINYMNTLK